MPIYTYGDSNQHTQQIAHSIKDDPAVICPKCGEAMKRIPQATRVQFNGKGWASKGD